MTKACFIQDISAALPMPPGMRYQASKTVWQTRGPHPQETAYLPVTP